MPQRLMAAGVTAVAIGLASVGARARLIAQEQPPPLPVSATFEVVSVRKSTDPAAQLGARQMGGGHLSAVLTVRSLVALAYGYPDTLRPAQLVGGPSWLDTDKFEINATFDGPVAIAPNSPPVRLLAMERALLADRFKLQVHQETRQLPVFDLVRSRADRLGPRLVKSDGSCLPLPSTSAPVTDFAPYCGVKRSVPGAMAAKGITLSRFALLISFLPDVQRIVRDRTGLTDTYDVEIEFARDAATNTQGSPPITTALKEQLGLELKPAMRPVSVIVIDHVEPPTPD
jgi:uncharacterized protein (TIGR03435 family)